MDTVTFRPTHCCFDDALSFLVEFTADEPPDHDMDLSHLRIVHGICRADTGWRYVHAWVEDKHRDNRVPVVWQAATINSDQPVWYAVTYDSFYSGYRVETRTRYTFEMAKEANKLSGHYGPWRSDYRDLIAMQGQDARATPTYLVKGVEFVKVVPRKVIL